MKKIEKIKTRAVALSDSPEKETVVNLSFCHEPVGFALVFHALVVTILAKCWRSTGKTCGKGVSRIIETPLRVYLTAKGYQL